MSERSQRFFIVARGNRVLGTDAKQPFTESAARRYHSLLLPQEPDSEVVEVEALSDYMREVADGDNR